MTHSLVFASLVFVVGACSACGGPAFSLGDAGGPDASSPSDAASKDSAVTPDAARDAVGPTGDASAECAAMLANIGTLRQQLQACCDDCNIAQCYQSVADFCCPISVNSSQSTQAIAFEAALQAYRAACGSPACAEIVCPHVPSDTCGLSGECQ